MEEERSCDQVARERGLVKERVERVFDERAMRTGVRFGWFRVRWAS